MVSVSELGFRRVAEGLGVWSLGLGVRVDHASTAEVHSDLCNSKTKS